MEEKEEEEERFLRDRMAATEVERWLKIDVCIV